MFKQLEINPKLKTQNKKQYPTSVELEQIPKDFILLAVIAATILCLLLQIRKKLKYTLIIRINLFVDVLNEAEFIQSSK
jgi:hypothetical protein